MFKVGEYYEYDAKAVASYLKDAGFKVDVRGRVTARIDHTASRQGKLSKIKEKLDNFEHYERFLDAVKAALEKNTSEDNFIDLMLTELDPNWKVVRDKFEMNGETDEEIDEDARDVIIKSMAEYALAIDFAKNFLELNEISPGEPLKEPLDDPLISIPISRFEALPDDSTLRERVDVDFEKEYEITIDEFSAPLFRELDEDFIDGFYTEYMKIMALGLLIEDLMENPEKGKIDIEDFADQCTVEIGDENILSVDGSLVAEEIARSLEKKGIMKMKGNTIKWKA